MLLLRGLHWTEFFTFPLYSSSDLSHDKVFWALVKFNSGHSDSDKCDIKTNMIPQLNSIVSMENTPPISTKHAGSHI